MQSKTLKWVNEDVRDFLKGYFRSGASNLQAYFDGLDEGIKKPLIKSLQRNNPDFSSNISEELKQRYSHLLNEELFPLAEKGTIEQFKELVALGANPGYADKEGMNAFSYALTEGRYEFAKGIYDNFPESISISDRTVLNKWLVSTAKEGDYTISLKLLDIGANPGYADDRGKTFFTYTLEQGEYKWSKYIKDKFPNSVSEIDKGALTAKSEKHAQASEIVKEPVATQEDSRREGETPESYAARVRKHGQEHGSQFEEAVTTISPGGPPLVPKSRVGPGIAQNEAAKAKDPHHYPELIAKQRKQQQELEGMQQR